VYKLFERLLLKRLQPFLEESLPIEQANFRKNRCCCDQTLTLATHIENGFKRQEKSGAVFLDLLSAYGLHYIRQAHRLHTYASAIADFRGECVDIIIIIYTQIYTTVLTKQTLLATSYIHIISSTHDA